MAMSGKLDEDKGSALEGAGEMCEERIVTGRWFLQHGGQKSSVLGQHLFGDNLGKEGSRKFSILHRLIISSLPRFPNFQRTIIVALLTARMFAKLLKRRTALQNIFL